MNRNTADASGTDWLSAWSAARDRLRQGLGDAVFNVWLAQLELIGCEKGELKLGAPSVFIRNWVASQYVGRIERALRAQGVEPAGISIVLAPQKPPIIGVTAQTPSPPHASVSYLPPKPAAADSGPYAKRTLSNRLLDPAQTFETFVAGASNEFAMGAARAFAQGEAPEMSLLYIHGSFGYGKTHLLNATALDAQRHGRRGLLLSAEEFMRRFLGALKTRETLSFKDELRGADMLLIDDLQHLCRSTYTMSEFLHTLNAFTDLGRKFVIAADRPPAALDGLTGDVRSRLLGGLVIALERPDRDTRLAILKSRAVEYARKRSQTAIPDGILERIADLEDTTPRDLIGAFNKLALYADLTQHPVSFEIALEQIVRGGQIARKVSIEDIQRKAAEFYKLDLRDFQSKQRSRRVARPRQIAMFLSRELTRRSLPEIGRRFGGRDHTTVLHACRRIAALCLEDPVFKQEVDFLKNVLHKAG